MITFREDKNSSTKYKQQYLDGFERIISEKEKQAEIHRHNYIKQIFDEPEKYRKAFKSMLGWPLTEEKSNNLPLVKIEKLAEDANCCIYRMQFEILTGLQMTGLFFKASGDEKKPLVIVQHGGLGTPELISGFYGSTVNYNDILQRTINQGVHAFAPQLLLWDNDCYNVKFDRKAIDARLKRIGSSVAAIEIYGITRILDYFENQSYVSSFGMIGMSYGGFYTLYTAAADTRIKSAISCSFFNKRDKYPWSDWIWQNSAEFFDDSEVACLVYPRKLCLEIGTRDELFDCNYGIEAFNELKDLCCSIRTDWLDFIEFDGIHEFCKNDEPIKALVNELKAISL